MNTSLLYILIILAGMGQVLLCLISLAIPKLLDWNKELSKINPLLKQMFWTYAGYILCINLFFGIVSLVAVDELLNFSKLSLALNLLMALYWIGRILIQFLYFDRKQAPKGLMYLLGEVLLISLFLFFSLVYSLAFFNLL